MHTPMDSYNWSSRKYKNSNWLGIGYTNQNLSSIPDQARKRETRDTKPNGPKPNLPFSEVATKPL